MRLTTRCLTQRSWKAINTRSDIILLLQRNQITSSQNQFIKLAASLHTKNGRKKSGLFLLEGETLLEEALKNNVEVQHVFVLGEYAEQAEASLEKETDISVFEVDKPLMNKIKSLDSEVNIVAIAKEFSIPEPNENKFILYCEHVQDPGNLGTIIRSAFGAGVSSIYLSSNCADIFNPKVLRSSMGSIFHGAIKKNVTLQDLEELEANIIASSPHTDHSHHDLSELIKKNDKANILMVGNEAKGMTEEALELANIKVKIPMANDIESLNVAAATSVLLFACEWNK